MTTTREFWAISGIGYGRGATPQEALENYTRAQLRNFPATSTVFKTKAKWEQALRVGEAAPNLYLAPEGASGYYADGAITWTMPDSDDVPCDGASHLVSLSPGRLTEFAEHGEHVPSIFDRVQVTL